ncbi:MAG: response regulator [Lachnospiraceae bacterium]|nr:response regulator [Lachnospiraceae bacterium]
MKGKKEYKDASDRLAIICMEHAEVDEASALARLFYEILPDTKIAGLTTTSEICDGVLSDHNITVTFLLFEKSSVRVLTYDTSRVSMPDIGSDITALADRTDNLRAIQIFINGVISGLSTMLDQIRPADKSIEVIGACAGVRANSGYTRDDQFVIGDKALKTGVIAIMYCGKELCAFSSYTIGWSPLGSSHHITSIEDSRKVLTIDGKPAADIYLKYLSVPRDKYFLSNTAEFPLIVSKYGKFVARSVIDIDESGAITLGGDVHPDENIRLSYGSKGGILQASSKAIRQLDSFKPQSIFLAISGIRAKYLGYDEQTEIDFFRKMPGDVAGCCCHAQITSINSHVVQTNNGLVALALRENGEKEPAAGKYNRFMSLTSPNGTIPLADRIYTLLRVTSEEYAEILAHDLKNEVEVQKAANDAKTQFLSNMSHEIRTPIHAAIGMNEMILRESRDQKIIEYARNVKHAQDMLLGLVNAVLDFSRIESGKMEIIGEEYSLSAALNDLMVMSYEKAQEKNLELKFTIDPSIPENLIGDELRIRQVVLNLLGNAIKYTGSGKVELVVSSRPAGAYSVALEIHIIDTGIGIRNEDLTRLFHPFERAKEKQNRTIEGTGLGLTISRKLLNLMGSDLNVSSEYGKGSDFSFTLVQNVSDWTPVGDFTEHARKIEHDKQNAEKKGATFIAPDAHILVVDDIAINHTVLKGLLKRTKVQLDFVFSGKDCLDICKKKKYDLILMDHLMPGLDGTETLRLLREDGAEVLNKHTPVVVLTANAIVGMREKFLQSGFTDYLSKPVNAIQLEDVISSNLPSGLVKPADDEDNAVLDNPPENESDEMIKDSLRKIDSLDYISGLDLCGSWDTYLTVLGEFTDSWTSKANALREFLKDGDLKNYNIIVHGLKNSAKLLGAESISADSAMLEKFSDEGDITAVKAKTLPLINKCNQLQDALREVLGARQDIALMNSPEISLEELNDAYHAIYEYVSTYDLDSADQIMRKLSTYRIPKSEALHYKKLRMLIREVKYEDILNYLEKVIQ